MLPCAAAAQIAKHVMGGGRLHIPPPEELPGGGFPGLGAYIQLMQQCWSQEPADRPTFGAVVEALK